MSKDHPRTQASRVLQRKARELARTSDMSYGQALAQLRRDEAASPQACQEPPHLIAPPFGDAGGTRSTLITGVAGAGKTHMVKEHLRFWLENQQARAIVIDQTGEYLPLADHYGGTVIRIAPDSPDHLNMFDLGSLFGVEALVERALAEPAWEDRWSLLPEGLVMSYARRGGPKRAVGSVLRDFGIAPMSHDDRRLPFAGREQQAPRLRDLQEKLRSPRRMNEYTEEVARRLGPYVADGPHAWLFDQYTTVTLPESGLVVVDMSAFRYGPLPFELGRWALPIVIDTIVERMRLTTSPSRPQLVYVEDSAMLGEHASWLLQQAPAEWWAGNDLQMVLVGQYIMGDDHVLSELVARCDTVILMRQLRSRLGDLKHIYRLDDDELVNLLDLRTGERVVLTKGEPLRLIRGLGRDPWPTGGPTT